MAYDSERSPGIWSIMDRFRPQREPGRRFIRISGPSRVSGELMEQVAQELALPEVLEQLDAGEVATLAAAAASAHRRLGHDGGVGAALQRLLAARHGELAADVALAAICDHGQHRDILTVLPGLQDGPELVEAVIEGASTGTMGQLERLVDIDSLAIRDFGQARRALAAAAASSDDILPTYLVAAAARGLGWNAWVRLFALLFDNRELAEGATSHAPGERRHENEISGRLRDQAWRELVPDMAVREVARLLLDLDGTLSSAGPDVRSVFVERLRAAIGGDPELRRSTIEALLWRAPHWQRDLALFAASRLVTLDDDTFLVDLAKHPDRGVGYSADILRHAVFGAVPADDGWSLPGVGVIGTGLLQLDFAPAAGDAPLTWLGDRLLERLIEQTVASEERRFAADYADHSEEGEEGLLRSFLSDLAQRFRLLDHGLRATAAATGATRTAGVNLSYRPVDKVEEGRPGVEPDDDDETPPDFSADLCLIVDPYLDGRPLGKRATLVQAKRLRLKDPKHPEGALDRSFKLDPGQMTDLMRQTASSFYLFQCEGLLGRGIPIIPTQLVEDLAKHQAASAAQISTDLVGPAAFSFAEWLTYVVLALRTGDPLAELVAKAEGGPRRRPRPLARFGTVEITVQVGQPKPRED